MFFGPRRVICNDQTVTGERAIGKTRRVEVKALEGVGQFGVTTGGDGHDRFQLEPAVIGERAQLPNVLC